MNTHHPLRYTLLATLVTSTLLISACNPFLIPVILTVIPSFLSDRLLYGRQPDL